MNNDPKLILSDEELQLVNDSSWILTKRVIIDKVYRLFGNLAEQIKVSLEKEKGWLPGEAVRSSAKISKGENYQQLPYVMLDCPRCFDTENILAVRTMFWWGNFFSMTLHLSGKYKKLFEGNIYTNGEILRQHDFYICVNKDQWHHHFEEGNYMPIKQAGEEDLGKLVRQKDFIKLAVKFPLQQWGNMDKLLEKSFTEILRAMKG